MVMFVHLAPEKAVNAIRRSGIRVAKHHHRDPNGVFAMPVTPNFYISHQWLRELKRGGQRTLFGVYFRVLDDEPVFIGHYNSNSVQMTASQAAGLIHNQENSEGYEIVISRRISPSEIHKIRRLPQVLGWRYSPGIRETFFCDCPVCVSPGEIKSRRKRMKGALREDSDGLWGKIPPFESLKHTIENAKDPLAIQDALTHLAAKRRRASCDFLEPLGAHPSTDVLLDLINALGNFTDPKARELLTILAESEKEEVSEHARRWLAED